MPDPIPASALSAGTLAVESLPSGTPAAEIARRVLEAAVPLVRASDREGFEVKWAVRVGRSPDLTRYDESAARRVASMVRENGTPAVLYRRLVGPWKEVEDA